MLAPGVGRFVVPLAAAAVVLALLLLLGAGPLLAAAALVEVVLVVLTAFFAAFFRDPERPVGEGVVSAADGRVRAVDPEGDRLRVSVFMNVTDVHVNRFPIAGRVVAVSEGGNGFRPAYRPDAEHNVRRSYRLETALGNVEVVQITGVVARRLVSFVHEGSIGRKGERLGMIVLGSRVDVLLPAQRAEAAVRPGDRVYAGTSTIARVRP